MNKSKSTGKLMLSAFAYDPATRMLLLLCTPENFYGNLKREARK
jgi:hypothetical protein